ncbi:hypothetical protein EVAR_59080_1 [Eumeta japonica]|uniref:Uncharacterized protein n=1 Tax=Eumeta variegata TaxID=151549 RepID=A0A4C1Z0L1_EUMVA|nr:hypothetical protein EVAR_59080_1 [Eumeta japonica]
MRATKSKSRWSPPSIDNRNLRRITNAVPISWIGIGYMGRGEQARKGCRRFEVLHFEVKSQLSDVGDSARVRRPSRFFTCGGIREPYQSDRLASHRYKLEKHHASVVVGLVSNIINNHKSTAGSRVIAPLTTSFAGRWFLLAFSVLEPPALSRSDGVTGRTDGSPLALDALSHF